ncbi:MAG TPA: serine/threonine-protein kinase [Candidatus Cybelea sp.]|nr:serine/threonine-protein kinase [Candidatus Cybelea sp.]
MNDSPNRDVEVFTEALQKPPRERAAFLERACAGDTSLRQRVEILLQAHEAAGDFLGEPASRLPAADPPGIVTGEKPGDRIGRYKLLQQIGEGGCGVVFMAQQEQPVHRRVALKVVKPGMDTKSVIARFEAERQALALMDHANIAHVFDAGATDNGRPYFVMELVRGVKITDYCDQHSLTTTERLALFVQVCDAVQHAHQKGIIHRDIKPSNILVTTTEDGKALPKVIDFGIAKATTGQRLTDKTLFTAFEMLIGTPAYMSPEQAALTSVDVDTRTDIYSLGVLLYELLTGSTPFDTGELLKAGLDEIRRVIREQDPVRPSTRLSKMTGADLTTIAQRRNSEPPRLIRAISGDLDWIVMKALEKDRRRRYESASGLGLDVQRFMSDEAIFARPPSRFYKFRKLVLRNKLLFFGMALILALFVVSLIVISASLAKERLAHLEAEAGRTAAQTQAAKSEQVTRFLKDMLQSVGPSYAHGRDTAMLHEILDQTAQRVGTELTNQPAVEAELRTLMGQVYLEIGLYGPAQEMQRLALAINQGLFGQESKEAAASLAELGLAYARDGKLAEAVAAHQQALAIRRRLPGDQDADIAASLSSLAEMYTQQGKVAEGKALVLEGLRIREKRFTRHSLQAANSLRSLSIILGDEGKWAEAETMAREVLATRRDLIGREDPLVATTLCDVAWAAGGQDKLEEAESLEREALAMRQKLLNAEDPDVAKSLYLVGDRLRQRHHLDEALPYLNRALAMERKILGENHPAALDTMHSMGLVLVEQGKLAEAEELDREAVGLWRKRGESEIPQGLSALDCLNRVLIAEKKFGDAQQLLDEALTPAFIREPSSAGVLDMRVDLMARRGRWQEAASDAGLVLDYQPADHYHYHKLAPLLVMTHDLPAYEQLCRKIILTFTNTTNPYVADRMAQDCLLLPDSGVDLNMVDKLADAAVAMGRGDVSMPFFQVCKAMSEYRQGRFVDAMEWAKKSLEAPPVAARAEANAILAMAQWRLGQKDVARDILAKGKTLAPPVLFERNPEDLGEDWLVWLHTRISLDEAAALIQPASAADSNTKKP